MLNRKGQNTAEYAILIALVIAVAIAMQTYVKRGIQGRVKDSSDDFVTGLSNDTNWSSISSVSATAQKQYEPEKLSSQATQETLEGSYETTEMAVGGTVTRESVQKTKQAVGDYQKQSY